MLALRAERRAFGPDLKAVMLQHITERNAAHLVGKFRDFHLLIGHPMERRTSLKVALTSSGEGQSDSVAGSTHSSSLGAFNFRRWIVWGETEFGLVLDEFGVKLFRTLVIAASGCGCDLHPQFGNAAFENDFRRI